MKRPPVPRTRIYDLYWYFASERHRVFERRVAGEPDPWTDDPILREFKFCNVFRPGPGHGPGRLVTAWRYPAPPPSPTALRAYLHGGPRSSPPKDGENRFATAATARDSDRIPACLITLSAGVDRPSRLITSSVARVPGHRLPGG